MNGAAHTRTAAANIEKSRERVPCFAYCVQKALFLEFTGESLVLNREGN